jgi:hypothetical protein
VKNILTIFDYTKATPLPLMSIVYDGGVHFYTYYVPNTGMKLRVIKENMGKLRELLCAGAVVNDFKSHVAAFGLEKRVDYNVYDLNLPKLNIDIKSINDAKKALVLLLKKVKKRKPMKWHNLLANASVVYQDIEDRGIYHGYRLEHPFYSLDTFTGRSKTLGFSVQGATSDIDLRPVSEASCYFVHFDWISSELAIAANRAGDDALKGAFKQSDPYTLVEKYINHPEETRDKCKIRFLKAMYSLAFNDEVFDVYPKLKGWLFDRLDYLEKYGCLDSIMGRKYKVNEAKKKRSVFNAQFQGSVAHAMQSVLVRLFNDYRYNIVTEVHDSIIMATEQVNIPGLVKDVVEVMRNPLDGLVDDPPHMAVTVSVGRKWKKWKKLKDYR